MLDYEVMRVCQQIALDTHNTIASVYYTYIQCIKQGQGQEEALQQTSLVLGNKKR